MNINELTIGEAREIGRLFSPANATATQDQTDLGPQQIIVLDRGFVYTGQAKIVGGFVRIENAKNIRVWGTSKGLGELIDGPTSSTKTDSVGTIVAPLSALIHIIKCNRSW